MTIPPPRRRTGRIPSAALVVAGVVVGTVAGLLGGSTPAHADPWSGSTTRASTVSMATLGSKVQLLAGSGTVDADGRRYSLSTVVGSVTGYVELINTSTVPVTASVAVATGNLVASTPATACSLPWVLPAGTCPGTSTVLAQNTSYSSPGLLDPGTAVHLRVQTTGVIGAVTLTTTPVVPRGPADRTTS